MEELLKFVELTQKFKGIKRQVVLAQENRDENDAEHSFQLALVAWYISSSKDLGLDMDKVMKYALAHDLVETYTGDVPFNHPSHSDKHKEEQLALERLKSEFPEFSDLHQVIEAYERREDEESRFVYALDKIIPVMNIYLDKGHSWKVHNISLDEIIRYKKDKVSVSPEVEEYFKIITEILEKEQNTLFN